VSGIFFTDSERIPNLFASQLGPGLAMPWPVKKIPDTLSFATRIRLFLKIFLAGAILHGLVDVTLWDAIANDMLVHAILLQDFSQICLEVPAHIGVH
jgi:hypothetical protein